MKYIYESHMGGIYFSDDEMSFDELYCDQCGDYDCLLGSCETLDEAWDILKEHTDLFDSSKCDSCPHTEDYDYCDEHCEEYAKSGGYATSYVMEFLYEAFPDDKRWNYIYLVASRCDDDNLLLMRCDHPDFNFCERHSLPYTVCFGDEHLNLVAKQLMVYMERVDETSFKLVLKENVDGKNICIFQCKDAMPSKGPNERAQYQSEHWYGYIKKENICPLEKQKMIFEKI